MTYIPVMGGEDWRNLIGEVIKYNPRTGKLTIEITDPEARQMLEQDRIALSLTVRIVPPSPR